MLVDKFYLMIFIYIVVTLSYIVVFRRAFSLLALQKWSLSEALSEPPTPPNPTLADPASPAKPFASSSRLIAFVGMVIISIIFVGTGYYALYALFYDAAILSDNLTTVGKYLMFGGTLFAPYLFNKVSTIGQ